MWRVLFRHVPKTNVWSSLLYHSSNPLPSAGNEWKNEKSTAKQLRLTQCYPISTSNGVRCHRDQIVVNSETRSSTSTIVISIVLSPTATVSKVITILRTDLPIQVDNGMSVITRDGLGNVHFKRYNSPVCKRKRKQWPENRFSFSIRCERSVHLPDTNLMRFLNESADVCVYLRPFSPTDTFVRTKRTFRFVLVTRSYLRIVNNKLRKIRRQQLSTRIVP